MSVLDLVIKDDFEKRNQHIIDFVVNESGHDIYITKNTNDKSLFKYIGQIPQVEKYFLIQIISCKYKSMFSVNINWIKEGRKSLNHQMLFIFDCEDKIYLWFFDESQIMVNYDFSPNESNYKHISIFTKYMVEYIL